MSPPPYPLPIGVIEPGDGDPAMIDSAPPVSVISDHVMSLVFKNQSQAAVQAAIVALRPDPTAPTAWAELEDCIGMILDRMQAHRISPAQTVALIRRVLRAG